MGCNAMAFIIFFSQENLNQRQWMVTSLIAYILFLAIIFLQNMFLYKKNQGQCVPFNTILFVIGCCTTKILNPRPIIPQT